MMHSVKAAGRNATFILFQPHGDCGTTHAHTYPPAHAPTVADGRGTWQPGREKESKKKEEEKT